MNNLFSLLLLSLLAVQTATAQEVPELVTDRPDQTESAVTVLPGWVQFEGGVTSFRRGSEVASAMARVGVVSGFEVRLAGSSRLSELDVNAVGVGGKVRLWDAQDARPEAALLAQVDLSTTGGAEAAEVRLAFGHELTERLSLGYNVGATWGNLRRTPDFLYTFTPGISLTPRLGAFAEVFGEGRWPSAAAGFTFLVAPNVQLDVSGAHSLRGDGYFIGFGASFRLPR